MKHIIKDVLSGSSMYPIARDVYQAILNPGPLKLRRRRKRLFRQFIEPGQLVFDVGANVGEFTEMFLSIGARVVSIEPNPRLIPVLRNVCSPYGSVIEEVALGPATGSALLNLSDWHGLSTLSAEWKAVSGTRYGTEWTEQMHVPVVTLDSLVKKHGRPHFVKIDVEGFESEVLKGMSCTPGYLTVEFHRDYLDATEQCLSLGCFTAETRFNYSLGEEPTLALSEWVSSEKLISLLGAMPEEKKYYGDVFAKFNASR